MGKKKLAWKERWRKNGGQEKKEYCRRNVRMTLMVPATHLAASAAAAAAALV